MWLTDLLPRRSLPLPPNQLAFLSLTLQALLTNELEVELELEATPTESETRVPSRPQTQSTQSGDVNEDEDEDCRTSCAQQNVQYILVGGTSSASASASADATLGSRATSARIGFESGSANARATDSVSPPESAPGKSNRMRLLDEYNTVRVQYEVQ